MKLTLTRKSRGIALFIAMITIVVMTIMMGGFFNAYRSHFSLTRSSNASQAASSACDSVFQYVVYRAEHDREWGSQPFQTVGEGDPRGAILDIAERPGTYEFVGTVYSVDASFEGTVYNNLSGAGTPAVAAQAKPGTLKCTVAAKVGDSTRRTEFLVRVAPLFDSSVLSRSDMRVDASRLYMRSKDVNRNFLRAEGDIYVPDLLGAANSQFLLPNSNTPDGKGMLWAKGDIYSYDGAGGAERVDEGDEIADAVRNSNGKLVSQADSHFSIFDLDQDNLQLPENQSPVAVPAGRWNFVRKEATVEWSANYGEGWSAEGHSGTAYAWVDVLEYYSSPDDPAPSAVYRSRHRTADLAAQVPGETGGWFSKDLDPNSVQANSVTVSDYPNLDVQVLSDNKLTYPEGATGDQTAEFDLLNQKFTVDKSVRVDVDGPFHLTSFNDPDADLSNAPDWLTDTPPPTLDLGYAEDASAPGGIAKATLFSSGTINIENGVTDGLGSVISTGGDVRLQPKDTAQVNVNVDSDGSGLLIFAGGDVVLQNPNESEDWNFKGLVYARNAVKMNGSLAEDVSFEGSVVALHENRDESNPDDSKGIEFIDCGQVEFIYNSELLDSYVRSLPGNRIQVETVYFKR